MKILGIYIISNRHSENSLFGELCRLLTKRIIITFFLVSLKKKNTKPTGKFCTGRVFVLRHLSESRSNSHIGRWLLVLSLI